MAKVTLADIIKKRTDQSISFEDAAQKFIDEIYTRFESTIVLARFFATIPLGDLPSFNQNFVGKVARNHNLIKSINDKTLILSLLGTRGQNPEWNKIRNSREHLGIPLVSVDFIEQIPMMSRFLKELGMDLRWVEAKDTDIIGNTMGNMSGTFYVRDALQATDKKGRKIISAQNFVRQYNVKTVFGFGGAYMLSNTFISIIIFTRKTRAKEQTEKFLQLLASFKIASFKFIKQGKFFS